MTTIELFNLIESGQYECVAGPLTNNVAWIQLKELTTKLCGTLNESAEIIYQNNKAKGFWDNERNVGELLMLVTSELGEAMEASRKDKYADWEGFEFELTDDDFHTKEQARREAFRIFIKDSFEDEIADAVIRLLDLAHGLKIDLARHIQEKVAYNTHRPMLHGKKF